MSRKEYKSYNFYPFPDPHKLYPHLPDKESEKYVNIEQNLSVIFGHTFFVIYSLKMYLHCKTNRTSQSIYFIMHDNIFK